MPKLLLGTNNRSKVAEYRALLKNIPYELVTLGELGLKIDVTESGRTFEENAALKAVAFTAESGLLTLADDSGLEVEALGGEPGPLSARYAGEGAGNTERISFLLKRLEEVPREKRQARFRCVIALAGCGEKLELFSGECLGLIAFEPKGNSGFGYDPVFYLPELGKTMAELTFNEKNWLSHRGKAARKVARRLRAGCGGKIPE